MLDDGTVHPDVKIAIAGRPNVGKSTLFNIMAGKRLSIVHDEPGVTRDYQIVPADLGDLKFYIMDTPGLENVADQSIPGLMRKKAEEAIHMADIILFIIDGQTGITAEDEYFATILRKSGKPVIVCYNKMDTNIAQDNFYNAYQLGFEHVVGISAEHKKGFNDLEGAIDIFWPEDVEKYDDTSPAMDEYLEEVILPEEMDEFGMLDAEFDEDREPYEPGEDFEVTETELDYDELDEDEESFQEFDEDHGKPVHLAIVGRPNVGKSTLFNSLLNEDRSLVGDQPGITRDAITVKRQFNEREYRLVDTAGMRKKARINERIEKMSVNDSLRAIRLAHVCVLVVDATQGLDKQDLMIASHISREGRAMVIALNKWDSVDNKREVLDRFFYKLEKVIPQWKNAYYVTMSALYGRNIDKLMLAVEDTYDVWNRRVRTGELNRWLNHIISHHPPPLVKGKPNKIKYITQAKARPPTFYLSVSRPDAFRESYKTYLVNCLKEDFGFDGVPVRLSLSTSKNPYKNK